MHPSTAPTQAPPAHPRTTRSAPAAPSQDVPGRFGDAINQALASPEPASSATPASPAPAGTVKVPPAKTPPAATALPKVDPVADSGKLEKDAPAAPATESPDKPSVGVAKPPKGLQAPTPSQPILPVPPQAAPPPVLPLPVLPLPVLPLQAAPMVTQPAALTSGAGDAVASTGQDSSTTPAAGIDGHQPPSALAPAAAQTAAPSASTPPSLAAAPSGAGHTAAPAAQKRPSAVMAEKELSAVTPAIPADAAPLPAAASVATPDAAPVPMPVPVPVPASVALHPAPAPSQAPAHSSAAGAPAFPPAAAQVGPVLASFAAGAAHPGAPQHLTIRLDPLDLGRVQVRIERSPDGSARVDLKVEKPDTLLLLLRDQPQLHRALDLAGVPSTERTLQFHRAPPDTTTAASSTPGGMAAQADAEGGHGQQRPGQPHSGRFATRGTAISLDEPMSGPAAFRRAGVDITA